MDIKSTIDLRIDTIIENPLDTSMVICPIGGPGQQDAVKLHCNETKGAYPTPALVEELRGIEYAYPHLDKGIEMKITSKDTTYETRTIVEEKVLVTDDNGNEYWILGDVVYKKDTTFTTYDTTFMKVLVPLDKGVTCNLSVKCTDMIFAGCAGDTSKVMRTWQILDWCNGSIKECMQWIVIETDGPVITKVLGKEVAEDEFGFQ